MEIMQTTSAAIYIGAVISVAIIVLGTTYGLSKIGSKAAEAIARQPEAGERVDGLARFTQALIEAAAVIGLVTCMMVIFMK